MNASKRLLRIGDLADRSGLSRHTLNHYLLLGLITEEARTPTGRCLFSPRVLGRLADIASMKPRRTLKQIRENLTRRAR
jgi:DNA-binding transcriptional MerR regulator